MKKMHLSREEQEILEGKSGKCLQKALQTLIIYANAMEAKKFVPVQGMGHLVIVTPTIGNGIRKEMLEEIIADNVKTVFPFTLDPLAPIGNENISYTSQEQTIIQEYFKDQLFYETAFLRLGAKDKNAFTCTCYLPEVGNVPKEGIILAWAESSAVIYANSVLGARTNRNGAIIDLLSNLIGRTPYYGLLTDAGRKANWLIQLKTSVLPDPKILGGFIGTKIQNGIPYILGLEKFLDTQLSSRNISYFKEFGAACASIGAIGLFHVDQITPEAKRKGIRLLKRKYTPLTIDDNDLVKYQAAISQKWINSNLQPIRCVVGCPHLSFYELLEWSNQIIRMLKQRWQNSVKIETIFFTSADVLNEFQKEEIFNDIIKTGVKFSSLCIEMLMINQVTAQLPIITDSIKLQHFTNARMLPKEEIIRIICDGFM